MNSYIILGGDKKMVVLLMDERYNPICTKQSKFNPDLADLAEQTTSRLAMEQYASHIKYQSDILVKVKPFKSYKWSEKSC